MKKNGVRKAGGSSEGGRQGEMGFDEKISMGVSETSKGNPTLAGEDERACQTESCEQMLEGGQ